MAEFVIKKLRSGGLITNYFCSSSCGHCLYNCSPHWEKRYIDPYTVEKNLRAVRALGCRSVHIGGGELLERLQKQARELKLEPHIQWRGALAQTEVLAQYREADLFVPP